MCGIAGIFDGKIAMNKYSILLRQMGNAIDYRGPDQEGYRVFPQTRCGLVCRRLSLVDLPGGNQPVANEDDTVHVIFKSDRVTLLVLKP